MKYLVDIEATIKIKDVMIDVDDFDKAKMVEAAIKNWFNDLRMNNHNPAYVEVDGATLENWNSQD